MKNQWQLQEAKEQFPTVVQEALRSGPQIIIQPDGETVIVLSLYEYHKLAAPPKTDLVEFFRNSPLYGIELDLRRDKETARKIEL